MLPPWFATLQNRMLVQALQHIRRWPQGPLWSYFLRLAILFGCLPFSEAMAKAQSNATVRVAGIVLKWIRADKEANLRRLEPMVREAAKGGARIVVTTECFLDGYAIKDKSIPLADYRALGEPIPDGKYFQRLAALAGELKIHLVAGMTEADGELRYNTSVLIGPDGKLIGKYRKHALEHERVRNTPGTNTPAFDTGLGRFGMMICADRKHPDLVNGIVAEGAAFLICPSGGMFGPKSNDPILQARSKENGRYIVFVHPCEFLVTGPDGAILTTTLLGNSLEIFAPEAGSEKDTKQVFFFDLPLKAR
jgi:predicted amidohydrolase